MRRATRCAASATRPPSAYRRARPDRPQRRLPGSETRRAMVIGRLLQPLCLVALPIDKAFTRVRRRRSLLTAQPPLADRLRRSPPLPSPSYLLRGQKKPAQAVLAVARDDVDVEVGNALADDVVERRRRCPAAPIASRTAADSMRALANSGSTSAVGQVPDRLVVLARDQQRVAREERPVVEEGERGVVLEDDVRLALAARRSRRRCSRASSGDDGQGAGLDAEVELAVVADVVAVDLHRERPQAPLAHRARPTRSAPR